MTRGGIFPHLFWFALPLLFGNLFQQLYNAVDSVVVGNFVGSAALGGVTSVMPCINTLVGFFLGMSTGASVVIAQYFGAKMGAELRRAVHTSLVGTFLLSLVFMALGWSITPFLVKSMQTAPTVAPHSITYLRIYFAGITGLMIYNMGSAILRAVGDSKRPLYFLALTSILNVVLDLLCVIVLGWGVAGAAGATVFSQYVSGVGIGLYTLKKFPYLCPRRADCRWDKRNLATILNLSVMTSVQQSIMNFGILMVQGLVNSFGIVIMAAFAAAVKIDSFAYMPVQDFGNAFSTYVAQNYGAGKSERIRKGIRSAGLTSAAFCILISVLVWAFAAPLMGIFVDPGQSEIIAAGVHYLRIEGACYIGIGILFLLYGYYRAVNKPMMSVVLTIASLGTRVALAYLLSATPLGVTGIWLSVPIGWALADAIGIGYYLKTKTA